MSAPLAHACLCDACPVERAVCETYGCPRLPEPLPPNPDDCPEDYRDLMALADRLYCTPRGEALMAAGGWDAVCLAATGRTLAGIDALRPHPPGPSHPEHQGPFYCGYCGAQYDTMREAAHHENGFCHFAPRLEPRVVENKVQ